jgi:hypothetical protein
MEIKINRLAELADRPNKTTEQEYEISLLIREIQHLVHLQKHGICSSMVRYSHRIPVRMYPARGHPVSKY